MRPVERDGIYRPASRYDDPPLLSERLVERILPLVARPGRYIGGELGAVRTGWRTQGANLLLAFPDTYELGMSHLGLRILYGLLAGRDDTFCDLAFAVWPDMEAALRQERLPLFGLESRRSARQFDVLGFSLAYELSYTNVLAMLDLAGIPLRAADRGEGDPLVIGGGACAMNPAVVAPFFDLLFLGDGETAVDDLANLVVEGKREQVGRDELLARARGLEGAWHDQVIEPVAVRVLADLNRSEPPPPLVSTTEAVHDRLAVELMRGCARGCRFCQAGMINRPVRERDVEKVAAAAAEGIAASGFGEVNLLSLSTTDFSALPQAVDAVREQLEGSRTNLVLPSLRVDSPGGSVFDRIGNERRVTFTFAPEAGTQRLRDVINKQITDDEIEDVVRRAFASDAKHIKLYFMIGLPTETDADLVGLVEVVERIVALAPRGGSQVHVSISPFAPKAHTPFQWAGQISRQEIRRRNEWLASRLRRLKVKIGLRDPNVAWLEALLGLGGAEVADAVQIAFETGARFDGWTEWLQIATWEEALANAGIDAEAVLGPRNVNDPLPWDAVAAPVTRSFLAADWARAQQGRTLADCRLSRSCFDCGACVADDGDHVFARAVSSDPDSAGETDDSPGAAEPRGAITTFDPRNADPQDPDREKRNWWIWRQQAANKCWYRIEFAKTGDQVFLGHLDFQRQLQLGLRRSGLPAAYSKGYHPHPLLRFGPPLPVGVAGEREYLDLALLHVAEDCASRLDGALPTGIDVTRALPLGGSVSRSIDQCVERCDYRIVLPPAGDGGPTRAQIASAVDAFLDSGEWLYIRRRPDKSDLEVEVGHLVPPGGLTLQELTVADPAVGAGERAVLAVSLVRDASGASLPVYDFVASLLGGQLADPRYCRIARTGCYGRDLQGRWRTPLEDVMAAAGQSRMRIRFNG